MTVPAQGGPTVNAAAVRPQTPDCNARLLCRRNRVPRRTLSSRTALEDIMTRALDVNENTEQNPEGPPQPQTGDDLRKKKVEGKAFQVNENSVDNPARAPVTPKRD